jgi:manganese transport protein
MATDLAEFVGAALALNLVFGVPMLPAGMITEMVAFIVLGLQVRGHRPFERAIAALLLIVTGGFAYELLRIQPSPLELTSRRVDVRDDAKRRQALSFQRWDVITALGLAGIVNLAMLMVAAKLFHSTATPA